MKKLKLSRETLAHLDRSLGAVDAPPPPQPPGLPTNDVYTACKCAQPPGGNGSAGICFAD